MTRRDDWSTWSDLIGDVIGAIALFLAPAALWIVLDATMARPNNVTPDPATGFHMKGY